MEKISSALHKNKSIISFVTLYKIWNSIVPPLIAKVTTPTMVNAKGDLTVLVHDNIWLTELNYMKEDLIEMLNNNNFMVKKLIFKYSPTYIPAEKPRKDFYEIGEPQLYFIENIVEHIDDEEMKQSFKEMLLAYFKTHTIEEFTNGGKS